VARGGLIWREAGLNANSWVLESQVGQRQISPSVLKSQVLSGGGVRWHTKVGGRKGASSNLGPFSLLSLVFSESLREKRGISILISTPEYLPFCDFAVRSGGEVNAAARRKRL
jgi:hypothetical protein